MDDRLDTVCKKCGVGGGWSGPVYKRFMAQPGNPQRRDWLEFTCKSCGYVRTEPTKDAPLGPPPPETDTGGIIDDTPRFVRWLRPWFSGKG
jgi:hypothetical protein